MADVFISFIHEEQEIAEAIQTFISKVLPCKADVFLSSDTWQIYAGEIWLERIVDELKDFVCTLRRAEDLGCRTGVLAICAEAPQRLRNGCDECFKVTPDQMLRDGWAVRG
jgi:hypothetical protein